MKRSRLKHAFVPSEVPRVSANVVDLAAYRYYSLPQNQPSRIFYVTQAKERLALLEALPSLKVETIQSHSQLKAKMMLHSPELVVIDSHLEWADVLHVIRDLDYFLDVPIVMLCGGAHAKERAFLVREAYASGVHDILFAPFDAEDIKQTLDVLLKFQRSAKTV